MSEPNLPPQDEDQQQIRKNGRWMLVVGWLLAIFILTMGFNSLLARKQNPNTISSLAKQSGSLVLQANELGMYFASGYLNGVRAEYVVDTGATYVAVPIELADDANLEPSRQIFLETAKGTTRGWETRINHLVIGTLELQDVKGVIVEQLDGPVLLGMSALKGLHMTQANGKLEIKSNF